MSPLDIDTPSGAARAHVHVAAGARTALVLGHGAGGGVAAPDLVAVTAVAIAHQVTVVLVEQPYRVAGRRSPAPAHQLDAAWIAVIDELRAGVLAGLLIVVGGRSSGARVACRTAVETGAAAVLCLAFPLQPPPRVGGATAPSRLSELDAVRVPTLVVQGVRDRFGMPPARRGRRVVQVSADHALRSDLGAVALAVKAWLAEVATA
jgi:predicted alpha/beta-hydrolase family hydrolase